MIPKECKRLAEVDFPIAVVSKHAAREKSIRHGHPSTLHLWWARRPLAACRAMLLGLLLPDPYDEHCPEDFKAKARELLPKVQGEVGHKDEDLRKSLLKFIGDFANWDLSSDRTYLEVSRALIKAAHPEETPLVVDPFAGGGSIPLEALRLGCETFASDLNPVACLILKVLLEDIPRHGPTLADELRRVGKQFKEAAEKELAEIYPSDPDGAKPIAYLWARTARCEQPDCGAEIPLVRSFWLCKKVSRKRALAPVVVQLAGQPPRVEFEIFEPKTEKEVRAGLVSGAKATCLPCGAVLTPDRVRAQLTAQRGGGDVVFDAMGQRTGGARLLAIVTLRPGEPGRHYRLPTDYDYQAVRKAHDRLAATLGKWERGGRQGLGPVPDETINPTRPSPNARGLSAVTRYGMECFADLFTARQRLLLTTLLSTVQAKVPAEAMREPLALVVDKIADKASSLCRWKATAEYMAGNTFSRQALAIAWDFCETAPFSGVSGGWSEEIEWISQVLAHLGTWLVTQGQAQLGDATEHPLPDQTAPIWFTDPPYYDAIPYADLSDFFLIWLKRALPEHKLLRDPFDSANTLTPKLRECVWNRAHSIEGRPKDRDFFERTINKCFQEGRRILRDDGIGSVVFAHQTTEGWEAFLGGLIGGGWNVTASWPIATEMASRVRARDNASLATSVHLICRPRPDDAPVGDWGDVLRELPKRVGDWMERLQAEGVRGADLVFACIGPSLEIFSRCSKVETAEGREVTLAEYLEKVWEVVGRTALEHVLGTAEARARNSMAGALEEDARLTALFLWTLQSTNNEQAEGERREAREEEAEEETEDDEEKTATKKKKKGYSLVFDVARRFAQPLGIHLDDWEGRVIETEKGIVRLLPVSERAKQLFGEDGAEFVADELERSPEKVTQLTLFPDNREGAAPEIKVKGRKQKAKVKGKAEIKTRHEATTLDRVHAAMLLQASGRTNALRALLKAEQDRSPDFERLANALSALYPRGSEEKRLLDAMLLAVPK